MCASTLCASASWTCEVLETCPAPVLLLSIRFANDSRRLQGPGRGEPRRDQGACVLNAMAPCGNPNPLTIVRDERLLVLL